MKHKITISPLIKEVENRLSLLESTNLMKKQLKNLLLKWRLHTTRGRILSL